MELNGIYQSLCGMSMNVWMSCQKEKKESTFLHSHSQDVRNDSDGPGGNKRGGREHMVKP